MPEEGEKKEVLGFLFGLVLFALGIFISKASKEFS